MALSERVQSIRDWVDRGKSLEEASEIANRNYTPSATETLNGVSVPTGYTKSKPEKVIDPYSEIKKQQAALLKAQTQQRIQALGAQRQSAMSALEAERGTVAPVYLQQRGNLSTTAQQTARGAEQSLAARGLTRGGSAVQGDIARNVALQQGMSNIGEAEAGTFANIAQRQTAAEQAYAQGVAGAESEAAATSAQNEIARLMQAQQAQEATAAKEIERGFEQDKLNQAHANNLEIERLRNEAAAAINEGDHAKALELLKQKDVYEKENIKLTASVKPKSSGSTPKVTEGQLNTLINNFNSAITSNPYYKYQYNGNKEEGGTAKFTTDAQKAKTFNDYLGQLDAKVAAGAIDQTTANSMYNYVQQNPEFQRLAPTIMALRGGQ